MCSDTVLLDLKFLSDLKSLRRVERHLPNLQLRHLPWWLSSSLSAADSQSPHRVLPQPWGKLSSPCRHFSPDDLTFCWRFKNYHVLVTLRSVRESDPTAAEFCNQPQAPQILHGLPCSLFSVVSQAGPVSNHTDRKLRALTHARACTYSSLSLGVGHF